MPIFLLSYKADLENLTDLQPREGCDDPGYGYFLKLKCESCGEVTQRETCVTLSETVTMPNSRGTAHLVQKCKFCGREGSVLMIPGHGKPLTLELSEAQALVPLMVFECRGFEPIEFVFADGWKAKSTSGTAYEIDLSQGDFAEYDEDGGCPVSLSNLEARFKVVHKKNKRGQTVYE
ncbi:unnamed protein product [Spirodela intermedia]|uniref:Uncharacterized protein n=2 Tax=Spirodela intermedia TaxID=51605 RepID=A0A7I8LL98_SPIIN|nr:unnamed protein product [Spirodela intermedia]CAA6672818.1 unnamed protein product [Spirodela intermedia]CAA7410038.1 unnamed protein product [Spirodela intermedia]